MFIVENPSDSVDLCESPIEISYFTAMKMALETIGDTSAKIFPQAQLGHYRYDFCICLGEIIFAVVECDGKKWHSTQEQIQNDINKTRFAMENALYILRFRGTDIYHKPNLCVDDTLKTIEMISKNWDKCNPGARK